MTARARGSVAVRVEIDEAERARKAIEADRSGLAWKPCQAEGPQGTRLARCVKLYVPLDQEGASAALYGFVFRLSKVDGGLAIPGFVRFGSLERMPIYEFECEDCGERFEELVAASLGSAPCPACGSERTRRLISTVSPPGRQPRGGAVRSDESRRGEREAARADRISESRKRRAAGEKP